MLRTAEPTDQPIHIIVVAHSKADREIVCHLIGEQQNFVVHETASGDGLLTMLADNKFDCVILDAKIGLESGLAIHNIMRTKYPDPPASILLSSNGNEQTAIKALRLGFDDYVKKQPSCQSELVKAILRAAESKRAERSQKAEIAQLAILAMRDQVTGVPSQKFLEERLLKILASSKRHGNYCAVLRIDVDHFEKINDSLGHAVGDVALRAFAKKLSESSRSSEMYGRFCGSEFLYLIDRDVSTEAVTQACRRLVGALSFSISIEGMGVSLSASIGAAIYPINGQAAAELLEAAGRALVLAKASDNGYVLACSPQPVCDDRGPAVAGASDAALEEKAHPPIVKAFDLVSAQGQGLLTDTPLNPNGRPEVLTARMQQVVASQTAPTLTLNGANRQQFSERNMPIISEAPSLKDFDRDKVQRVATRHRVIKRGLILFNNECSTLNCQIRDLSTHGAKIVIDSECVIPNHCLLTIVDSRKTFSAEKRWQNGRNAGLMFLEEREPPRKFSIPE